MSAGSRAFARDHIRPGEASGRVGADTGRRPPDRLERFTRRGDELVGKGSGRVSIRRGGCAVRTPLPFELALPRGC